MLILNDFDETITFGNGVFHSRITDDFSMLTIDSTTANNHESTLGTDTNDLENDSESARLSSMNSNSESLEFVNHGHPCQPFCLENDCCDINSV